MLQFAQENHHRHDRAGPSGTEPGRAEAGARIVRRESVSLCIAFSVQWRKLVYYFKQYPWLLVPAFDLRRPLAERRATLQKFLDASKCCLDKGLCLALRTLTSNIDDYFDSVLHEFLVTFFERVVVTSTQVELIFSNLTRITSGHNGGAGPATLAAKYIINAFCPNGGALAQDSAQAGT